MRNVTILLAVAAMLALVAPASGGANYYWVSAGNYSDWDQLIRWDSPSIGTDALVLPTSSDDTYIRGTSVGLRTCDIDSGTGAATAASVHIGDDLEGILNITGGSLAGGDFYVGDADTAGTLTVTGNTVSSISGSSYTQADLGKWTMALAGGAKLGGVRTIAISGAAAFDGTLTVTHPSDYFFNNADSAWGTDANWDRPAVAGTYTLMTYGSTSGSFDTVTLPNVDNWSYSVGGVVANALTVTYDGGDEGVPVTSTYGSAADHAYINNGGIARITTEDAKGRYVIVGDGDGYGELRISGGSLTASAGGTTKLAIGGDGGSGKVVQTGGDVSGFGYVFLGYTTGSGTYEISGGTFSSTSQFRTRGTSVFKVIGDDATITLSGSTFSTSAASANATLAFEIDSGGISPIQFTHASAAYHLPGILTVTDDGAALGTYTLMTYVVKPDGDFTTVNLPSGDWSLNVGDTSMTVTYVPEPATLALLGLGGIGVLLRKRRK